MRLEHVELVRVAMPLVRPFRTSFGVQHTRGVLLVHVLTDVGEGWGECAAHAEPFYNEEFTESAMIVLQRWLVPAVGALEGPERSLGAADLEVAVLDRANGRRMFRRIEDDEVASLLAD